jgi:hypothetical protein
MAGQDDLNTHFDSALHHRVEVFDLKPEQHTVSVGPVGWIAYGPVVVSDFKAVQLKNEPAVMDQLLIVATAVRSTAPKQALIPSAAGFDVCHADERLGAHGFQRSRRCFFGAD